MLESQDDAGNVPANGVEATEIFDLVIASDVPRHRITPITFGSGGEEQPESKLVVTRRAGCQRW